MVVGRMSPPRGSFAYARLNSFRQQVSGRRRNGEISCQGAGAHEKGGGEMDIDSARVWFEKSAHQGNAKACANLAELWNYQSENHMARIEALRWMLVAGDLSEVQSKQHYGEIKSFLSREEEKIARQLADLTLGVIRK